VLVISRSFKCKAREIGVEINRYGYVYSYPVIRAYVNADAVATMQSKLLRFKLPLRPYESTALDQDARERIIEFCIELRRRVVEGILKFRPRRVSGIFNYAYQWAKIKSMTIEKIVGDLGSRLIDYFYEELFIAPYYLHYYNIIDIDLFKYDLFWEVSE